MIYGFVPGGDHEKGYRRAQAAGVRFCRSHDLSTGDSAAAVESQVLYAAQRGIKLLLMFNMGSADMALGNLVSQIARVGPAGTMWNSGQSGAGLGALAPTHIEVGNEFSFSYKGDPASNAVGIANSVQRFYNAVGPTLGANAMKFICEGEDAGSGTDAFMNSLHNTVPSIRSLLDGWVVHPYGPVVAEQDGTVYNSLPRLVNRLNARGYTTDKIWITEDGISSDDGRMLTNNYGFKRNCTYDEAATRLLSLVRHMGTGLSYSSRIYCFMDYKAVDHAAPGATNDREAYFGRYKIDESPKGALTSASITLATEFPFGGSTPPPPPDPVDPPASGFVINGQTMQWAAVSGATGYKTYERDNGLYTNHGAGVLSYTPAARPPGTSISVGWTYVDSIGDHWVAEQTITYPASTTALVGTSVMTLSGQATAIESAPQSGEITDVVYRMVSVAKVYSTPTPFQVSTGRELVWDPAVSKFFYKP